MTEQTALAIADHGHVFSGIAAFDSAQRMAKALSSSALVPKIYQGQTGLANSLIALEIAGRMKISPLTVMQNMTPINGRPTWSSSFLIATVNTSGRFTPLRFVFDNEESPTSCYAEAQDIATGEVLKGEKITLAMAKAEGWLTRPGSKWQTFPGQMLRYRAGAFWTRAYCPEISLGLITKEEVIDIEPVRVSLPGEPKPAVPEIEAGIDVELTPEVLEPEIEPEPMPEPKQEPEPAAPVLQQQPRNTALLTGANRKALLAKITALEPEARESILASFRAEFKIADGDEVAPLITQQQHAIFLNEQLN